MTHRSIEHLRRAGRGTEPQAVVGGAEMRPSLDHLARYSDLRLRRIEAVFDGGFAPRRITTTGLGLAGQSILRIPLAGPFPNVSRHIVETVSIRREGTSRRCSVITVEHKILPGKLTLPRIGHSLA